MWEFGEDSVKMRISRLAHEYQPAKQVTWEAHARIWRVIVKLDFTSHSWLKPSRKWPVKLSIWLFWVCLFSYLYQHYINPYYPRKVSRTRSIHKKLLREKTLAKHLRVRDCLPTILNIISECWKEFWYLWEVLEEAIKTWMQSGGIVGVRVIFVVIG